jgi:Tfp pilus assembly protein PilX
LVWILLVKVTKNAYRSGNSPVKAKRSFINDIFKKKTSWKEIEMRCSLKEYIKGRLRSKYQDQSGHILPIALMILVVLSLLGAAAIITSTTDLEIASNEKQYQMAFYTADGGADMTPRIIRDTISLFDEPDYGSNVSVADGWLDELMNFSTSNNDGSTDTTQNNPDIQITNLTSTHTVSIDVDANPSVIVMPGGGMEFGSGFEGIGSGASSGGTATLYTVESLSQGSRNSSSTIRNQYLYVYGIGGS